MPASEERCRVEPGDLTIGSSDDLKRKEAMIRCPIIRFLFVLFGRGISLRLVFFFCFLGRVFRRGFAFWSGFGRTGMTLFGVVGHVPAGALELDGRSTEELLYGVLSARGTLIRHGIGELLDLLEPVLTGFALKLVKWHGWLLSKAKDSLLQF